MKEKNNWDAIRYKNEASFVSNMAMGVVELLASKKDENILDVGCGEGQLAQEIIKSGAKVIGIDSSADMVAKAKVQGIEASVKDILEIEYKNQFDAVFSNAVLHWVNEPEKVVQNIHKALSSKGRFVGEFGGIGNCKIVVDAIETVLEKNNFGVFNNPWYFPSIKEYTQVLESNGFDVEYIELIPRPTPIADIITWLELFANGIVKDLDGKQTEIFKNEVQQLVKNKLYDDTKGWFVDYVRLRFKAVKRD